MTMDVYIHCPHHKPPLVRPSHRKLTVKFTLHKYMRFVHHQSDGTRLVHYHPFDDPRTYVWPPNPLCNRCNYQIVSFLIHHGWSMLKAIKEFDSFREEVMNQVLIIGNRRDRRKKKFSHLYEVRSYDHGEAVVDNAESFRELVAGGEIFVVGTFPASDSAIKGLERVVKKVDVDDLVKGDNNVCGICLQELVMITQKEEEKSVSGSTSRIISDDGDVDVDNITKRSVVILPCKHLFHEDCVVTWLHKSPVCPFCRFELPVAVDQMNERMIE